MAELFNITHDAGNLNEYDSTVTDGGDLSAAVAAALAGTAYGLQCVIDDTTSIYGQKNASLSGKTQLRFRYYFDPNSASMSNGGEYYVATWQTAATSVLYTRHHYWNNYLIRVIVKDDGGSPTQGGDVTLTDDVHYIEVHVTKATTAEASDGSVALYVDGTLEDTITNLDFYDNFENLNKALFGIYVPADITGTVYLDEFKANDDGSEIGPVTAAFPPVPGRVHRDRRSPLLRM